MKNQLTILAATLAFAPTAKAQVVITTASTPYAQNFDTLTAPNTAPGGTTEANGTAANWADNTANTTGLTINGVTNATRFGLVGWYAYATTDRDVDFNTTIGGAGPVNRLWGNTGTSTAARLYSYSVAGTNPVADKALGALAGASSGSYILGLRFTNNTGAAIQSLTVSYAGEQWRVGSATARGVTLDYINGNPANLNDTGWTNVAGGGFTSPTLSATSSALDGNASGNRVSISSVAITPVGGWAAGADLWLRWVLPATGGTQGLAIDDVSVSFTAVPEPSGFAAFAGLGVLALAASRRRARR